MRTSGVSRAVVGATVFASFALASGSAGAHFSLDKPASWMSQDVNGAPEKAPPCGDEGGGTPTHVVTAFAKGDTITITIDEKIFHPGHYRVALAVHDRSEFPAEPKVHKGSNTPCGTADVQDPPVFPVLADNLLVHTTPFSGPKTIQVKLPANVTCDHCTLQVIEFMSNHPLNMPGGCFYHHCADISISDSPVDGGATGGSGGSGETFTTTVTTTEEAGGSASTEPTSGGGGGAGGSGGVESSSGSCGCATPGGGASTAAGLAGFALVFAFARRRRPARR